MADVIEIDLKRRKRRILLGEAVGRFVRCSACQARCARCGLMADEEAYPLIEYEVVLCPICHTEYDVYRQRLEGRSDPELYWLNDEWMETWRTWLEHQKAVASFRRSKEFQRFLTEPPDV